MSNDCYLKDTCFKYLQKDDCECKSGDVFCPKLFKLDNMYRNALLTQNQRKRVGLVLTDKDECDREKFTRLSEISENIVDFINNGNNLYIHSTISGNGKTSWALRLMQSYFGKIWAYSSLDGCVGLFINVPRFLLSLKDNISEKNEYIEHIKNNVLNADLVIWDDIATKNSTEFESENLLSLIDTRINNNKSNIFTSNMGSDDLYNLLGPRLASRIANLSEDIELNGVDKRNLGR